MTGARVGPEPEESAPARVVARAGGGGARLHLLELQARRCVVLSPHLDDAVLSCGNLLADLAPARPVLVATAFTEGSAPHTASARAFLTQCGAHSGAAALYAQRRREDVEVLEGLGVRWVHAGLADALFRKLPPAPRRRLLRELLPELGHVYPTYRWHVASGRVAPRDAEAVAAVAALVQDLVRREPSLLLAPLGVGGHVDHVLVRDAAARSGAPVVYYADVPYSLAADPDPAFVDRHALVRVSLPAGQPGKTALIEGYRSQAAALFPSGVPGLDDEYYVPAALLDVRP